MKNSTGTSDADKGRLACNNTKGIMYLLLVLFIFKAAYRVLCANATGHVLFQCPWKTAARLGKQKDK